MRTSAATSKRAKIQPSEKVIIAVAAFCLGLIVPLIGLYVVMPSVASVTPAFVGPKDARVELVKETSKAWFGDAYYVYQDFEMEHKLLIAPSLTLEEDEVTNSFDSIFYTNALLSPDGRWVALPATCWEETCLRIYDVKTQSLHWANHAATDVSWSADGRLHAKGECASPRVEACGPFESISTDAPWMMRQAQ